VKEPFKILYGINAARFQGPGEIGFVAIGKAAYNSFRRAGDIPAPIPENLSFKVFFKSSRARLRPFGTPVNEAACRIAFIPYLLFIAEGGFVKNVLQGKESGIPPDAGKIAGAKFSIKLYSTSVIIITVKRISKFFLGNSRGSPGGIGYFDVRVVFKQAVCEIRRAGIGIPHIMPGNAGGECVQIPQVKRRASAKPDVTAKQGVDKLPVCSIIAIVCHNFLLL
jgi:hypothetical protein